MPGNAAVLVFIALLMLVAPDESYLIFSSRDRAGYGSGDLFVSFRTADGGWTEPQNMGPTTTDAEIYWMDASIIEALRQD